MRYITSSYMAIAFGSRPPWSRLHGLGEDSTASLNIRVLRPKREWLRLRCSLHHKSCIETKYLRVYRVVLYHLTPSLAGINLFAVDIGQKTIHNKALCEDIFGHHTFVILYLRIALHFILMMILVWYFHWRRGRPNSDEPNQGTACSQECGPLAFRHWEILGLQPNNFTCDS